MLKSADTYQHDITKEFIQSLSSNSGAPGGPANEADKEQPKW